MEKITKQGSERLKKIFGKDENFVSKRESFIKVLNQYHSIEYLMRELFKKDPNHKVFENLSKEKIAELQWLKFKDLEKK